MSELTWLTWVLSGLSLAMGWLMGNKSKWGPRLGIINQLLWIFYCIVTKQWGFLPGVVAYLFIHIRNALKWEGVKIVIFGKEIT